MNYHSQRLNRTLVVKNSVDRSRDLLAYLASNRNQVKYYQDKKIGVLLINDRDCTLPRFAHPVFVPSDSKLIVDNTNYVFADIRGLRDGEAQLMERYAHHVAVWESPEIRDNFSNLTLLPMISYVNWVTSVFSNRFNLDAEEAQKLSVMFALFYQTASKSHAELLSKEEITTTVNRIVRATGLTETNIINALEMLEEGDMGTDQHAPTIYQLAQWLRKISPRLQKLITPENIIAPLAPTFMGSRGTTIAGVAVEYPPAFLTMLITVLEDRTYQRCTLKKVVGERVLTGRYKQLGDEFLRSYVWYKNQYFS